MAVSCDSKRFVNSVAFRGDDDARCCCLTADPSAPPELPEDYVERVKTMHESGGHGSIGYRYDWKRSEADKLLLRTHTTAVSARMLYKLATVRF